MQLLLLYKSSIMNKLLRTLLFQAQELIEGQDRDIYNHTTHIIVIPLRVNQFKRNFTQPYENFSSQTLITKHIIVLLGLKLKKTLHQHHKN